MQKTKWSREQAIDLFELLIDTQAQKWFSKCDWALNRNAWPVHRFIWSGKIEKIMELRELAKTNLGD